MTRQRFIDADQLLAFIRFLQALEDTPSPDPEYTDREWVLLQVSAWVIAKVDQPTLRSIEEGVPV